MWNTQTLGDLVARHPKGGTFWTRSHRTVRYLRNLFLDDGGTVVSVMSDIARGRPTEVYVFVKTGEDAQVSAFSAENGLEVERLLAAPALSILPEEVREEAEEFISTPNETFVPTW